MCLGVKPWAAGWKAQTNPLSYGGTQLSSLGVCQQAILRESISMVVPLTLSTNLPKKLHSTNEFPGQHFKAVILRKNERVRERERECERVRERESEREMLIWCCHFLFLSLFCFHCCCFVISVNCPSIKLLSVNNAQHAPLSPASLFLHWGSM